MDRNSITGVVLMVLVTVVYFMFFVETPEEQPQNAPAQTEQTVTTTETPEAVTTTDQAATPMDSLQLDSAETARLRDTYSDFFSLVDQENEIIKVVTDKFTLEFNTVGGNLHAAYLNEYKTFDSLPLPVIAPNEANIFRFDFSYNNRAINNTMLAFSPSVKDLTVTGSDSAKFVMRADIGGDRYIEQIYTLKGDRYDLGYEIRFHGIKKELGNLSTFNLLWESHIPKTELAIKNQRQKSTIAYRLGDDVEKFSYTDDIEEAEMGAGLEWISYKSQFFSQILDSKRPFRKGKSIMTTPENDQVARVMRTELFVDMQPTDDVVTEFSMFMGPNEFATLNSYKRKYQKQLDLGWWFISYINMGTTYVFKFLEKYIPSYGLIIIIMAFMIRLLMFPLSYKSYVSMAKMRVINNTDEMKALDAKHKDDPQKLQMAKMQVYREMGVSMFGGCVPMLLSYPFLIAFFFFFPQSVELRQQPFLWANDLSTYDSIFQLPFTIPMYGDHVSLFTLLMAISTFIYTYYQQKSQPTSAAGNQMKYIAYIMPIFLLGFLNNYASGLSLYYLISNIIQITQTSLIRLSLNDEKILEQMKETQRQSKKGKKGKKGGGSAPKGRLQKWMEDQQKKQQEIMKQQQRAKNQGSNRKGRK
ncbi:membrane protein insertase YidC [Pontibacter sp. G13]|uniref:membrane protein insertase YidC n=1 Tax=Pontibacter sp. G13 TaxID=3074898 RepID=UPI00288AEC5F|nr:membrane protein insertase YidC [Pontibacter sp. G13]WNJ18661.1 membrane protein insertase YidC [Pontibacter sp. G13]